MIHGTFSGNDFVLPTSTPLPNDQSAIVAGDMIQAAVNAEKGGTVHGALMRPAPSMMRGMYMGADAGASNPVADALSGPIDWIKNNPGTAALIGAAILIGPNLLRSSRR